MWWVQRGSPASAGACRAVSGEVGQLWSFGQPDHTGLLIGGDRAWGNAEAGWVASRTGVFGSCSDTRLDLLAHRWLLVDVLGRFAHGEVPVAGVLVFRAASSDVDAGQGRRSVPLGVAGVWWAGQRARTATFSPASGGAPSTVLMWAWIQIRYGLPSRSRSRRQCPPTYP